MKNTYKYNNINKFKTKSIFYIVENHLSCTFCFCLMNNIFIELLS